MSMSAKERWEARNKLWPLYFWGWSFQIFKVHCPKCHSDAKLYYDFVGDKWGSLIIGVLRSKYYEQECALICNKCHYVQEDTINFFEKLIMFGLPMLICVLAFAVTLNYVSGLSLPNWVLKYGFFAFILFLGCLFFITYQIVTCFILLRKFK